MTTLVYAVNCSNGRCSKEAAVQLQGTFEGTRSFTGKVISKDTTEHGYVLVDIDSEIRFENRLHPVGTPVMWCKDPMQDVVYTGNVVGYSNDMDGKIAYVVTNGQQTGDVSRKYVHLVR